MLIKLIDLGQGFEAPFFLTLLLKKVTWLVNVWQISSCFHQWNSCPKGELINTFFKVDGLAPDTTFTFDVYALNAKGPSIPVRLTTHTKKAHADVKYSFSAGSYIASIPTRVCFIII